MHSLLLAVPRLAWGIPDRVGYVTNALFAALQATAAQQIGVSDCCWLLPTPPVVSPAK